MDWLQVITLALVQGFTEFLPISSSAHLILIPRFSDWPDQGLGFDLAVHLGTLAAVISYFRHDLVTLVTDTLRSLQQRRHTGDSRLAWAVVWGTIPVGLAGLLFGDWIEAHLREPLVIAVTTIGFGLLLWWADRRAGQRDEHGLGWRDWLLVGCAQALALIPGTSRSGITLTAGLLLGLSREAAARYAFLLAIPVISLASGLKTVELVRGSAPVDWSAFLTGALIAAATAYLCIHYFLRLLTRFGLLPYVVYRLLLGFVLLGLGFGPGLTAAVTATPGSH